LRNFTQKLEIRLPVQLSRKRFRVIEELLAIWVACPRGRIRGRRGTRGRRGLLQVVFLVQIAWHGTRWENSLILGYQLPFGRFEAAELKALAAQDQLHIRALVRHVVELGAVTAVALLSV